MSSVSVFEAKRLLAEAKAYDKEQKAKHRAEKRSNQHAAKVHEALMAKRKLEVESRLRPFLASNVVVDFDANQDGIMLSALGQKDCYITACGDDMTFLDIS